MCADLQRSCTPAASRRVVDGRPGTRTNRPAFLRRLVGVPVSRPHPRNARARPLAHRRLARSPASHDPRESASIRDSCPARYATSLAFRPGHWGVGRWNPSGSRMRNELELRTSASTGPAISAASRSRQRMMQLTNRIGTLLVSTRRGREVRRVSLLSWCGAGRRGGAKIRSSEAGRSHDRVVRTRAQETLRRRICHIHPTSVTTDSPTAPACAVRASRAVVSVLRRRGWAKRTTEGCRRSG